MNQKTVKVKFVGVCPGFEPYWMELYNIIERHYDVQIVDKDPDYILCDAFEPFYDYCGYPQVRIMVNGENYVPDFNLVDYAISRYPIQFGDRNFYMPGCLYPIKHWMALAEKDRNYDRSILDEKPYFANFIASHESEGNIRGDFFKKLCEYKRVESPGKYLNNCSDVGVTVRWDNESKTDFQKKCKFTLCFESTVHNGFITEKITDAFYSDTIPVYYGSPNVTEIFNKDAFINCADYDSFDDVIEKIKELDRDDEKYLAMLRQPILVDPGYTQRVFDDMERFVCSIFDQPIENAYRRSRVYIPQEYDEVLSKVMHRYNYSPIKRCKKLAKRMLKL